MPSAVQVGTILMKDWPLKMQLVGLQTEPCSGNWSMVNAPAGSALDDKINAAGWSFFFMAAEVKVMFLGALRAKRIQKALERILGKVKRLDFNGLEITQIVAKHFLGVPYTIVSAHSRHVQQSLYLDTAEARRNTQPEAAGAKT